MSKWFIWAFAAFFLFYAYFLMVFPSVMVDDLMFSFKVHATALGALSAFYFYAYAPMQIPFGLLMDRIGLRNLLSFAALICGLGCFLFAFSKHLVLGEIGRFLMGGGSALAFIGLVYVCSHFFSGKMLALLIGFGNSIGMLGAAFGLGPLSLVVEILGWRSTVFILGVIGLLLAIVIYLLFRNFHEKKKHEKQTLKQLLRNLKIVSRSLQTWINALGALGVFIGTGAFASLWAVPFLTSAFHLSNEVASFAVSMVFIGWIVGGPIVGNLSDKAGHRRPWLLVLTFLGGIVLSMLIYIPLLSTSIVFLLMFLLGVFSSGELLCFSIVVECNPRHAKGTAIALTNLIISIGCAAFQPLVGLLLDFYWKGKEAGEIRFYSADAFRFALTTFPVMFLVAFVLFLFLKEEKKKKTTPI